MTFTPATGAADTTAVGSVSGPGDGGVKLDVGSGSTTGFPGGPDGIPTTCAGAESMETTVGCSYYAVDLDQAGGLGTGTETDQFAVVVGNVQLEATALVTVERKVDGSWTLLEGPVEVAPRGLHVFELPDLHQESSGKLVGGAYRVRSDVPVAAYQFNPLRAAVESSDASLLYPAASWDTRADVVQWPSGAGRSYVTIVAARDGTLVDVVPVTATAPGPDVPAGGPSTPIQVSLDEGDVAEIMVLEPDADITGTSITSNEEHPIAVFAGHECANIPASTIACDHLEEQLPGLRLWGTRFVAARVVPRSPEAPEDSLWHLYASEDDTEVAITAPAGVTGLPDGPVVLDRGERLELFVTGSPESPGDFYVETSKPAALVNYMTSWANLVGSNQGDPAMVVATPIEQFLPRYVLLVPSAWEVDTLVITRSAGAEILLDGVAVPDDAFVGVGAGFEVARVRVEDGVHALDGSASFGVSVVGYDFANSYAYQGGAGTARINPIPVR